jgi:hypothetical protein
VQPTAEVRAIAHDGVIAFTASEHITTPHAADVVIALSAVDNVVGITRFDIIVARTSIDDVAVVFEDRGFLAFDIHGVAVGPAFVDLPVETTVEQRITNLLQHGADAALARKPHVAAAEEVVVTVAAVYGVGSGTADNEIVAGTASNQVVAGTSRGEVIAAKSLDDVSACRVNDAVGCIYRGAC